jgi:SHS2 domain-containing protein
MVKNRGFEFLEHVSDAKFRAWGKTVEEAFVSAGEALFGLMVDTGKIKPDLEVKIHVEADSIEWLLFEWLTELLYQFDVEDVVFSDFDLTIRVRKEDDIYMLDGVSYGARIDPVETEIDILVKAITLHDLAVKSEQDRISLEVVVDV